jgi:hypothetical protein
MRHGFSINRFQSRREIETGKLTAKFHEADRVIGLEMGAEDYRPKPLGSCEVHRAHQGDPPRLPGEAGAGGRHSLSVKTLRMARMRSIRF